jgi:hypothetical protein
VTNGLCVKRENQRVYLPFTISRSRAVIRRNIVISMKTWGVTCLWAVWALTGFGASITKTLRVEHGRPVVVVSEKGVLLLEFVKQPVKEALVPTEEPKVRHCQAKYRWRVFDGGSGAITNGEGTVKEVYRTLSQTSTGRNVENAGSQTTIDAGEFSMWWSEATAGSRSWLYYRVSSGIRFIQQPQSIRFDDVDRQMFERYLKSINVKEFVAVGRTVQVIGPAVFSGDLPLEKPASGRIESCAVRDGAFELNLSNLATNQTYVIESSYEVKAGNWNAVHTFIAREAKEFWSDPLGKDVTIAFYRIREGN